MATADLSNYGCYQNQKSELMPREYSRTDWFDFCFKEMPLRLNRILDQEKFDEKDALEVFRYFTLLPDNQNLTNLSILEDLLLGLDQHTKGKDQMDSFLVCFHFIIFKHFLQQIFSSLICLAESRSLFVRKRAQSIFSCYLDSFQYDCQCQILCRMFEMVATETIAVEREPQVFFYKGKCSNLCILF